MGHVTFWGRGDRRSGVRTEKVTRGCDRSEEALGTRALCILCEGRIPSCGGGSCPCSRALCPGVVFPETPQCARDPCDLTQFPPMQPLFSLAGPFVGLVLSGILSSCPAWHVGSSPPEEAGAGLPFPVWVVEHLGMARGFLCFLCLLTGYPGMCESLLNERCCPLYLCFYFCFCFPSLKPQAFTRS